MKVNLIIIELHQVKFVIKYIKEDFFCQGNFNFFLTLFNISIVESEEDLNFGT